MSSSSVLSTCLPPLLAREQGRDADRTEEEDMWTGLRRTGERHGGNYQNKEILEEEAGEGERRSQSLEILRRPFDKTLSYEDSKIVRDLIKKKIDEKTQDAIEITTKLSTTDEKIKSSKEKVEATTEQIESYLKTNNRADRKLFE